MCKARGDAMINIREVAKMAGVSPATVSRVMNDSSYVSPEKRQRVLDAIAETDFVPNEAARTLFKRSSKTIGLIIPSIRNPFFTQFAGVIDEEAKEHGYRLFLCNVDDDLQQERAALQKMVAASVDGVIIASTNDEIQSDLEEYPLPVIVVVARMKTEKVNAYIYCNYYEGGRLAVRHLYEECGCRNIVCIRGPQHIYTARARYEGYRNYCLERGIPEQTVDCDYDFKAGLEMTKELLEKYPDVDGILACDDIVAISTFKVLYNKGIRVPEQVQLVGFDDIYLSSLISPELTTVHQPIEEMAKKAARMLLEQNIPPKMGENFIFPVSLVVRETTRGKVTESVNGEGEN